MFGGVGALELRLPLFEMIAGDRRTKPLFHASFPNALPEQFDRSVEEPLLDCGSQAACLVPQLITFTSGPEAPFDNDRRAARQERLGNTPLKALDRRALCCIPQIDTKPRHPVVWA